MASEDKFLVRCVADPLDAAKLESWKWVNLKRCNVIEQRRPLKLALGFKLHHDIKQMRGELSLAWELVMPFVQVDDFLSLRSSCYQLCNMLNEHGEATRWWRTAYNACDYRLPFGQSSYLSNLAKRLHARKKVRFAWDELKSFMGPGFEWSLQPPASELSIQLFENTLGRELDYELRESLLLHDGQIDGRTEGQPFPRFYSIAEMEFKMHEMRTLFSSALRGTTRILLIPVSEGNVYLELPSGVVCLQPGLLAQSAISVDPSWSAYLTVR